MDLFVGNLPPFATWQELKDLFSDYGFVSHSKIVMDRETGKSRGFGFIEMDSEVEAAAAVADLNGFEWHGRRIEVRPSQRELNRGGAALPGPPVSPKRQRELNGGREVRKTPELPRGVELKMDRWTSSEGGHDGERRRRRRRRSNG